MNQLLNLEQAKMHRRTADHEDYEVDFLTQIASEVVLTHLKLTEIPEAWITDDSPPGLAVPGSVQAAVLLVLGELYENREASAADLLSPTVIHLLEQFRDPTLA